MGSGILVDWDKRLIRYSPWPINDYFYFNSASEKYIGFAYCFFDSPLGWNLYWLCEPKLDHFPDIAPNLGQEVFAEAERALDRGLFHKCLLALERDDARREPFLRAALTLPPTQFMAELESRLPMPHLSLFAYQPAMPDLLATMWQRARHSESVAAPPVAMRSNVITVDFRNRR